MKINLIIEDGKIEVVSKDPLELAELERIFKALEAQGLKVRKDPIAPQDQPLESKLIKGRLCG